MKRLRMLQPLLTLAISRIRSGTASLPAHAGAPQSSAVITSPTSQSSGVDAGDEELLSPADRVAILATKKGTQPLILNVGPKLLFDQAHIPDAEYVGTASTPPRIRGAMNSCEVSRRRFSFRSGNAVGVAGSYPSCGVAERLRSHLRES